MVDKNLYDSDFNLWATLMSEAVEKRDVNAIDWENLAIEVECLSDSLKTQLENHLQQLIEYVLIIRYCPKLDKINYCKSRAVSQQHQIKRILRRNPSLNKFVEQEYSEVFEDAIACSRFLFEVPEDSFIQLSEILKLNFPDL